METEMPETVPGPGSPVTTPSTPTPPTRAPSPRFRFSIRKSGPSVPATYMEAESMTTACATQPRVAPLSPSTTDS
jgi:hypothetical protein